MNLSANKHVVKLNGLFKNKRKEIKTMKEYQITASETENTKIQAGASASFNAGIVISVFSIQLAAMLEKGEQGTRVLVCPATENPMQSVSLKNICASAGVSDSTQTSIDGVLKDFLGFTGGLAGTTIDVNQAFFYYSSYESDKTAGGVNQEYALSLGMTNDFTPITPKSVPFEIKSVSFSLWNSTRQKIVDSMGMTTVNDVLKKFS